MWWKYWTLSFLLLSCLPLLSLTTAGSQIRASSEAEGSPVINRERELATQLSSAFWDKESKGHAVIFQEKIEKSSTVLCKVSSNQVKAKWSAELFTIMLCDWGWIPAQIPNRNPSWSCQLRPQQSYYPTVLKFETAFLKDFKSYSVPGGKKIWVVDWLIVIPQSKRHKQTYTHICAVAA